MPYGTVFTTKDLVGAKLPPPRGPLSAAVIDMLATQPAKARLMRWSGPSDDPLYGDDSALALYCLYELHYRGWAGVSEDWEWHPGLLDWRRHLEAEMEARLCEEVGSLEPEPNLPEALFELRNSPGVPSISQHLLTEGTLAQLRESVIHKSAYQLKEADPHTWLIPRLTGRPKAALVEIQADEYGQGVERDMHQTLFAVTMQELGLNPAYHAYLEALPGPTLAAVNVVSMFGLHRRLRGACAGHLAMFEMSSVEPMGATAAALRRLGCSADARHFYAAHVVADAHHQTVGARDLASALAEQEPHLASQILFGAAVVGTVEGEVSRRMLTAWDRGESSLLGTAKRTAARAS